MISREKTRAFIALVPLLFCCAFPKNASVCLLVIPCVISVYYSYNATMLAPHGKPGSAALSGWLGLGGIVGCLLLGLVYESRKDEVRKQEKEERMRMVRDRLANRDETLERISRDGACDRLEMELLYGYHSDPYGFDLTSALSCESATFEQVGTKAVLRGVRLETKKGSANVSACFERNKLSWNLMQVGGDVSCL
ncbi:hypothetical protein [Archangium lipolyticum]|uniref:hypothetical protein n=1 Tax=Archangium lipolyticum TaxID=2970465 RepID=UPI002149C5FA|nr:hypothetical protein [Archangium lipolyticum]